MVDTAWTNPHFFIPKTLENVVISTLVELHTHNAPYVEATVFQPSYADIRLRKNVEITRV